MTSGLWLSNLPYKVSDINNKKHKQCLTLVVHIDKYDTNSPISMTIITDFLEFLEENYGGITNCRSFSTISPAKPHTTPLVNQKE